jgi:hypothetical protein
VAGLLFGLVTACSGDSEPPAEKAEPNLAGATCPGDAAAGTKVAFTAGDGAALVGIELGQGRTGVVLAHQNSSDLCEWLPYGKRLADKTSHAFCCQAAVGSGCAGVNAVASW